MNDVVEKVVKTLALQIEGSGAPIAAGPLPVLHRTNETQMHQLMQNLVSNALNYLIFLFFFTSAQSNHALTTIPSIPAPCGW